jgi:hypothetical protein
MVVSMGKGLPGIFDAANRTDAIAFEVARNEAGAGVPILELLATIDVAPEEFTKLLKDKLFTGAMLRHKKEFEESGGSFQTRAQIVAAEALKEMYTLIHDRDEPASVRRQGINDVVRWAGWDNNAANAKGAHIGTGFSITFNLAAPAEAPQMGITIETEKDE